MNLKSGMIAGIIAGVIFLILEMVMVPLFLDGSPWGPPRMIGAIVLGKGVLPPPATFDIGIVLTAVILHMVLSIIYGIGIGMIIKRMSFGMAILTGAVAGFIIYLVNFYIFTSIWPWFANARHWVSIFAHIVFGLAAAWAFIKLHENKTATLS